MSKTDTQRATANGFFSQFPNAFIDAWIVMLALGGLGHINHWPQLYLGYWSCLLINIVAICVMPNTMILTRVQMKILEKLPL